MPGWTRITPRTASASTTGRDAVPSNQPAPDGGAALLGPERIVTAVRELWASASRYAPLLPVVQVVALLVVIWLRTDPVLWRDEWQMIPLLQRGDQGTLRLSDFWAFYNEHRIFLPRLIEYTLILLTRWNRQVLMTVNVAALGGTVALLYGCVRHTFASRRVRLALLIPISLTLFSFSLYEDLFITFSLNLLLTAFGAALCMAALLAPRPRWRDVLLAAAGALVATLSAASGLLVWLAFLPILTRAGWRKAALWSAGTVAIWAIYLDGFTGYPRNTFSPGETLAFLLMYLGAPLRGGNLSLVWGAGGLLLAGASVLAYLWLRGPLAPLLPWLCLALFALGCAVMTTYGRADTGVEHALLSRYQVFSGVWWIAVFGLIALLATHLAAMARAGKMGRAPAITALRALMTAGVAATVVACGILAATNFPAYRYTESLLAPQRQNVGCALHYQTAPHACLAVYMPDTPWKVSQLRQDFLPYLQRHHLALFSGS